MQEANQIAFDRLISARPVLDGCGKAGERIPGFRRNLILHSGPPVEFAAMRGPHRNGVIGAALFEARGIHVGQVVGNNVNIELLSHHAGGAGPQRTHHKASLLALPRLPHTLLRAAGIKKGNLAVPEASGRRRLPVTPCRYP